MAGVMVVVALFTFLQVRQVELAGQQDPGVVAAHVRDIWMQGLIRFGIEALLIAVITILIIRWNVMAPITRAADWIKGFRLGLHEDEPRALPKDILGPLTSEVAHMAKSLAEARASAEAEAKLRVAAEALWTPERLKEHARAKLQGKPLFVVANREPYVHSFKGKDIEWAVPASGLVTAIEPILRSCGGLWIAHGSGDADKMVVDENDKVRVPPMEPQYTLKRIWLSKEEEDGYYYGFSNEGLWPLCHIAHARPIFLPEDWAYYQSVNQKFADALLEEMKDTEEPCVLVQDYHFALLPRMIKEKRPDARVALFWHIPWPNPESFGICPWARELLHGMLGADLLGFHIQYHCNNFLDTVDRILESRIDWERFNVYRQNHTTWVKPFPISVAFPSASSNGTPQKTKDELLRALGVKADFLGIGVDRIDYTKGIMERFRGIEAFLDKNPAYVGRFTFVEIGAPSRTLIERYKNLGDEVEQETERINNRFKTKEWKPIVLLKKHHSAKEIEPYYKAADVCMVTSLHDGMNLVAKEYVAARSNDDGVLILSRFTGASRELRDALVINPYDVAQTGDAIRKALEMDPLEKAARMQHMRENVRDHNIYRWGGNLLTELTAVRVPKLEKV
jgi:trehalose 6-phosphate synthase